MGGRYLEAGTLQVRRMFSNREFKRVHAPPKPPRARRSVSLTPTVIEALKRPSERQAHEMVRAGTLYQDRGFVFASLVGTPLSRRNLTRAFTRRCSSAQVPPTLLAFTT